MIVKVRHGYTLKLGEDVHSENTLLEVTEDEYRDKHYLLEKIEPKNQTEKDFYAKKVQEVKDSKKKVITTEMVTVKIRGGYAHTDPKTGKVMPGGTVITISEQEYMERHWIFDQLGEVAPEVKKEEDKLFGDTVGLVLIVPKESIIAVKEKEEPVNEGKKEEEAEEEDGDKEDSEKTKEEPIEEKLMDTKSHRAILRRPIRIETKKGGKK